MSRPQSGIALLLFHTGRAAERFFRATSYIAAGIRRIDDIKRDMQQSWDVFYQTHGSTETRLLPWEIEYVDGFVMPGAGVLLVGCGSGRDLLPLVERGCRTTGVDPSRSGLAIAARDLEARGMSAPLIQGFFEDVPVADTFDAVIFSYYCYSTIAMAQRRIAALTKAASLLNPRGHIVVSFPAPVQRPHPILTRLGQLAGTVSGSDWRIEPGDMLWDNRENRPSLSFTHVFEEGEVEREAAAANLRVVCRRTGGDNSRVLVLALR
jgi:SAM-dependent methyltransferase